MVCGDVSLCNKPGAFLHLYAMVWAYDEAVKSGALETDPRPLDETS